MSEHKSPPLYIWLGGIFLSWLGFAGFADNMFEWREWFEIGVMEHWRAVKMWITKTVLFWVPFSVPSWVVDYLLLGGVFLRPYTLQTSQKAQANAEKEMRGRRVRSYTTQHRSGLPVIWAIPTLLFWPIVLFDEVKDLLSNKLKGSENPQVEAMLKMLLVSLISFILLLFVVTDIIGACNL
jgi:hypothetical protein